MLAGAQQSPSADEYDLQTALQTRLSATQADREAVQFSLKDLEKEIQHHIHSLPKRIAHTDEELERLVHEKQFKYQTSTMSSRDERAMLKEIDKLKQSKKQLAEYNAMQDRIDELKRRRTAMQEDLRMKELSISEIRKGLKKLQLLTKLNINASELMEDSMPVPADAIPRIVGKNWARLHDLEEQYGVVIDIDRTALMAQITGTTSGILAARDRIAIIIDTASEEVDLSEVQVVTLLHSRAARINQLSTQFDVRIDASLTKKQVRITGRTADVAAAKEAVLSVDARVDTIQVEESLRGALIGKGGSNIRQLQEDYGVQIDLSREDGKISITGPVEGVREAGAYVRAFIDENQETEVVLEGQRSAVLTSIVGKNGETIRNLQREMGVAIKVDRKEEGDKTSKEEPSAMINVLIRGPVSKIQAARQRLLGLLSMCDQQSVIVPVPERVLPAVIGKKGATVQALRQKFPNATVDVDWTLCCVRIHSISDEERQAVQEEIEGIVEQNFSVEVPIDDDLAIALKGNRGAETRKQISELQVNMEIDSTSELVRLRGPRDAVYDAANVLQVFTDNNHSAELALELDDESALLSGGESSLIHKLQQEMEVEIHVMRRLHYAKFRGRKENVLVAREKLRKILEGDLMAGSAVVAVELEAMGSVIGKGGANIKAIEKKFNVDVDLLRTRHQIRFRGEPDHVVAAKEHLVRFMCTVRVTETIPVPADSNITTLTETLNAVGQRYSVQVEKVGEHISIRGGLYDVAEARTRLMCEVTDSASCSIPIEESHASQLASNLPSLSEQTKTVIQLSDSHDAVEISGSVKRVDVARIAVYRVLDALFPFNYNHIPADHATLHAVGNRANLQLIQEGTGARLQRDVESGCVRIFGSENQLHAATDRLREVFQKYHDTHTSVEVDESIAAELRSDKQPGRLRKLSQQYGAEIKISERANVIKISAADGATLATAKQAVAALLEQLRKEIQDVHIEEDAIGRVLGKGGARLKTLQTKHKCSIFLDRTTSVVRIRGSEEHVQAATAEIQAVLADWKDSNYREEMFLPGQFVAALIGPRGANIQKVQSQFRVKVDVNRDKENAIIVGRKADVEQARGDIISRLGPEFEAAQHAHAAQKAAHAKPVAEEEKPSRATAFPAIPPGAPQNMVDRLTSGGKGKRRRKKNKASADEDEDTSIPSREHSPTPELAAPVEEIPARAPVAPVQPTVPVQTAQPAQPAQPLKSAQPPAQSNGHAAKKSTTASVDGLDRGIYASPPPGLEDMTGSSAPSQTSGKSEELLAMLLGGAQAPREDKSSAASSSAAATGDKVEYYTSSSGFSIRL